MRRDAPKTTIAAALAFAIASALPFQAGAASVYACAPAAFGFEPGPSCDSNTGEGVVARQEFSVQHSDGFHYYSEAVVRAGYGWGKGSVVAGITRIDEDADDTTQINPSASAFFSWSDTFFINNEDLAGTTGTANAYLSVEVDAFTGGGVLWELWAQIADGFSDRLNADREGPANETYMVPFEFVYGQPIDLSVWFRAIGVADGNALYSFDAWEVYVLFPNSVVWQGFSDVKDEVGQLVSFETTSVSGTNWSQAAVIPVPPALLLFASAVGLLGWISRGSALLKPSQA